MSRSFGYEKLIVYQKGMRFAQVRKGLLERLPRRVVVCEHLDRGAESILVNIAHANSTRSPNERIVYLGHANGSALECAACLDVLVAKNLLAADDVYPAKSLLAEVVSMLIAMRNTAANKISENHAQYRTKKGSLFEHEDLEVYQVALRVVTWLECMLGEFSCSADLKKKLDKSTTSIVLNIAEGNGRFSGTDQAKFYETAYKAAVHAASLVDIAAANDAAHVSQIEEGRELLQRIAAMLTALAKVAVHH